MKETILLVGHGSRNKTGNEEIEAFARQWQESQPQWHIETCFIEFADVLLDDGLDNAAHYASEHGKRVIVVPLILNAAGHVKMEIPAHIAAARERHSDITFIYARHLGISENILNILKRNLRKAMQALDMPDPKTTGVIVLGRGSSDAVANGELAKITRWLYEAGDHELVEVAFTGISHPRLELVVQRQAKLGMGQIIVLPYYLFSGTLIERIHRQLTHVQTQYPQLRFTGGEYFGFENEIQQQLSARTQEALTCSGAGPLMLECEGCQYRRDYRQEAIEHNAQRIETRSPMQCDGCQYRLLAEAHGHGHHHHDHGHEHTHTHSHQHKHGHQHEHQHEHSHENQQEVVA